MFFLSFWFLFLSSIKKAVKKRPTNSLHRILKEFIFVKASHWLMSLWRISTHITNYASKLHCVVLTPWCVCVCVYVCVCVCRGWTSFLSGFREDGCLDPVSSVRAELVHESNPVPLQLQVTPETTHRPPPTHLHCLGYNTHTHTDTHTHTHTHKHRPPPTYLDFLW